MANYQAATVTNDFKVTDEDRYNELFALLIGGGEVEDYSAKNPDGSITHSFGSIGDGCDIDVDTEKTDMDFDDWLDELQKILADNEVFVLTSSGHEKLRSVCGYAIVMTKDAKESIDINHWANKKAEELLSRAEKEAEEEEMELD